MEEAENQIAEARELLNKALNTLRAKLDERGGRGVDLANQIDQIDFAITALNGQLFCPHCEARITSE